MARKKGSLSLSGNLEVKAGAPLDARMIVPTEEDLLNAENFPYKYVGMPVIVQDTGIIYILKNTDVTDLGNWNKFEGGDLIQKTVLPAPSAGLTGVIYQYVGNDTADLKKGYFYKCNGEEWEYCSTNKTGLEAISLKVAKQGYVTTLVAEDPSGKTTTYILDGRDGIDGVDGTDGVSPTLTIGQNGNWIVDSIDSGVPARGEKGERGDGFQIEHVYATAEEMVEATDTTPNSTAVIVEATNTMFIRLEGYTKDTYPGWMELGGLGDLTVIRGDKGEPGMNGVTPTIDPTTKHWIIGEFDTGVIAQGTNGTDGADGADGVDGVTPSINPTTHHWMIGAIDTGVLAQGFTPTLSISENNTWVINGLDTGKGASPTIDETNKHWIVDGIDTNIIAEAQDGLTPVIDPNTKHWMIGDADTGIVAEGNDGTTYSIDPVTKTWIVDGVDTGVKAEGQNGEAPAVTIGENNHWYVDGNDTGVLAVGAKGDPGAGFVVSKIYDTAAEMLADNTVVDSTMAVVKEKSAIYLYHAGYNEEEYPNWMKIIDVDNLALIKGEKGDTGDVGTDGFSPSITATRNGNKTVIEITQKSGVSTTEIFDGEFAYNDLELRGKIADNAADIATLNSDDTVEGSVDNKIKVALGSFTSIKYKVLSSLPPTGENGVFYLIPAPTAGTQNVYEEYIYVNNKFELIGTTKIDLTDYAKKSEVPTKVSDLTNDSGYLTDVPTATDSELGVVKVDGTTITIDEQGTLHGSPLSGVSSDEGNILEEKADGLYVPKTDLTEYALSNSVPTKTSDLVNDGSDESSTYVEADELAIVATTGAYSDLSGTPSNLSDFNNDLGVATTNKPGFVQPDGDTVTIDSNGVITATIGQNSLSRDEGNQIELHNDGLYINAYNEDAIYDTIDAVDMASPTLVEYTEDELYQLAWEDIQIKEKEEYTEAELDEILDGIDYSGIGGGGGGASLPKGGTTGQVLTKKSNSDGDAEWTNPASDANSYKSTDTAETTIADDDKIPFYDTSATGKRNSTWSNIKAKLKSYFDTIYSTVTTRKTPASGGTELSLVTTGDMYNWNNPTIPITVNKFNMANYYSTTEIVVGCWTNGKPIYQKVFYSAMAQTNTDGTFATLDIAIGASVEAFVKIEGCAYKATAASIPIPGSAGSNANYRVRCLGFPNDYSDSSKNCIKLYNSTKSWNTYNAYIIVQYTKTTDAENSFDYTDTDVIDIEYSGTASATTIKKQVVKVNNTIKEIAGTGYLESSTKTTENNVDTFTFTNAEITQDKVYDFYCDTYGKHPIDAVVSNGSIQVKFNSSDNVDKCRVYIRE